MRVPDAHQILEMLVQGFLDALSRKQRLEWSSRFVQHERRVERRGGGGRPSTEQERTHKKNPQDNKPGWYLYRLNAVLREDEDERAPAGLFYQFSIALAACLSTVRTSLSHRIRRPLDRPSVNGKFTSSYSICLSSQQAATNWLRAVILFSTTLSLRAMAVVALPG